MVAVHPSDTRLASRRLVALLTAAAASGELVQALESATQTLEARARHAQAVIRMGIQLEADPFVTAAVATGRDIRSFDAVVQVEGAAESVLVSVLEGLNDLLGEALGTESSTAVVGDVHVLTPGSGDTLLALAACRRPDITPERMHDYWLREHAALALHLMPETAPSQFGYNQLHVDAAASRVAATRLGLASSGFDGLLQVWCEKPEDFLAVATEPTFAARIFEDEKHFADQSRLQGAAFRTWSSV